MRNIWVKSNRKKINIFYIVSLVLYIVVYLVAIITIDNVSVQNDNQEVVEVSKNINKVARLCYATEGIYPANIDYLKIHYGLNIDEEKYVVHYEIFASNIPPEIKVFRLN